MDEPHVTSELIAQTSELAAMRCSDGIFAVMFAHPIVHIHCCQIFEKKYTEDNCAVINGYILLYDGPTCDMFHINQTIGATGDEIPSVYREYLRQYFLAMEAKCHSALSRSLTLSFRRRLEAWQTGLFRRQTHGYERSKSYIFHYSGDFVICLYGKKFYIFHRPTAHLGKNFFTGVIPTAIAGPLLDARAIDLNISKTIAGETYLEDYFYYAYIRRYGKTHKVRISTRVPKHDHYRVLAAYYADRAAY